MSLAEPESPQQERHYALVAQLLGGFPHSMQRAMLTRYSSYREIFTQPAADCAELAAIQEQYHRGCWQPALGSLLEQVERLGAEIIPVTSPEYPAQLKQISTAPPVIYVLGNSTCLHLPQIAVIGSRRMTRGGETHAVKWAQCLAGAGFTITSGLALGIDGAAHRGALLGPDSAASTIAGMATGIDRIYPNRHRRLADQILQAGGALITEFPPGTDPLPAHFPRRNRIISGLSLGVLVIEAAVKSGSLITARYAMEQNREVFAIPGSIHNTQSRGCHALIKQGATLVETAADIVAELQGPLAGLIDDLPSPPQDDLLLSLDREERQLLDQLGFEVSDRDSLSAHFSAEKLSQLLISLELKGVISNDHGNYQRLM